MKGKRRARKGKASYISDKDRVYDFLKERQGEEYNAKTVAVFLQKIHKDERPFKKIYNGIRQSLRRLVREGKIISHKKGFFVFPSDNDIDQEVDELEKRLSDLIQMEKHEPPKFHNIHYYIKKSNCDKMKDSLPDRLKSLFNAMSPNSMYQAFAKRNVAEIKGGVQERFDYKGCAVTIQCFGTGAVNITINASQTPLSFEDVLYFEAWLDALLQTTSGYSFDELKELTTVCWEWNNDKNQTERIDASGKYAITVRQFDDMVSRVYLKHFHDGSVKERMEQAITKDIPYPDWLVQSSVMFSGGVNSQFLIRQQYEHEKEMEKMGKVLEVQGNALLLNQNLLAKQGMDTAHLQECIDKMAKEMGISLPQKKNTLRETDKS